MKKPKLGQPQTSDEPQGRDLFQTPNYAVDLLVPFIPKHIKRIWDCAVGEGRLARRLQFHGYTLLGSDIRDCGGAYFNFLTGEGADISWNEGYAIVTNPPFSLKRQFFEKCVSRSVPFALLVPADYSLWTIDAVRDYQCEKIVPSRRVDYITPNVFERIFQGETLLAVNRSRKQHGMVKIKRFSKLSPTLIAQFGLPEYRFESIESVPVKLLLKYSTAQFHSLWLTQGFGIGRSETFVELSLKNKENI